MLHSPTILSANRRAFHQLAAAVACASIWPGPWAQAPANTANAPSPKRLEPVRFGTNWRAQAGHGGFYQALADGTYERFGLAVDIQMGGPQANNRPWLAEGKLDFLMAGNLLHSFDAAKAGVPTLAVAAMFQKDPQALLAHPGQGYNSFKSLASAPAAWIAKDGQQTFWQWLKAEHGFKDERIKPYVFNIEPFLADKQSILQGYSITEPMTIKLRGGFDPVVHLLADNGFSTYSTTIEARLDTTQRRPELVQRFVDASIVGWNNYLYGDNRAANALIQRANPEQTSAALAGSLALMKKQGIVDSGDTLKLGIGALRPERVQDFFNKMVRAGLYKAGEVDLARVSTSQFVNKGVGLDVRRRLLRR